MKVDSKDAPKGYKAVIDEGICTGCAFFNLTYGTCNNPSANCHGDKRADGVSVIFIKVAERGRPSGEKEQLLQELYERTKLGFLRSRGFRAKISLADAERLKAIMDDKDKWSDRYRRLIARIDTFVDDATKERN